MNFSYNDIKQNLRKKEFPQSVCEVLKKSDELLRQINNGWGQKERHMDFIADLISEFIFNEGSDRRNRRKQTTRSEELVLMLTILDHMLFESSEVGAIRNALFLLLFPGHKPHRSRFLVLLTSLSLSCSTVPVLDSAAVLLQQVGFASGFSRHFARSIVDGYFMLVSLESKCVKDLPLTAPLFTANFITALTETYNNNGINDEVPIELIELIVEWLRISKTFVFSPLMRKYQMSLPPGSIAMPPVTSHSGLLRWWAIGWSKDIHKDLFNQLEGLLMDSLCLRTEVLDSATISPTVFTSSDLLSVVAILTGCHRAPLQICLDKFAHILSVILHTKTLLINTQDFWKTLSRLPKNASKLLDCIIVQNMIY